MTNRSLIRSGVDLGLALWTAAVIPVLTGCQTEDVSPKQRVLSSSQGVSQGELLVVFSDSEATAAENQSRIAMNLDGTPYEVFIDGQQVVSNQDSTPTPMLVGAGNEATGGYLDEGTHHFAFAAAGAAPIFEGDGPIVGGAMNRLYLFGPLSGLQSRFSSYPLTPAAGTAHVSAINLIRTGESIEVVSCSDASTCTPLSPALALGDTYDSDLPLGAFINNFDGELPNGGSLGFRQVPSAALPNPPVRPLPRGLQLPDFTNPTFGTSPANFIAAPEYMLDQGYVVSQFK